MSRAIRQADSLRSITGSYVIPIGSAKGVRVSSVLFTLFCVLLWALSFLSAAAAAHREATDCSSPAVRVR